MYRNKNQSKQMHITELSFPQRLKMVGKTILFPILAEYLAFISHPICVF